MGTIVLILVLPMTESKRRNVVCASELLQAIDEQFTVTSVGLSALSVRTYSSYALFLSDDVLPVNVNHYSGMSSLSQILTLGMLNLLKIRTTADNARGNPWTFWRAIKPFMHCNSNTSQDAIHLKEDKTLITDN